jgi:hypothetical protein
MLPSWWHVLGTASCGSRRGFFRSGADEYDIEGCDKLIQLVPINSLFETEI